ncbi:MAG TPA: ATP-dependent helicase HrpB [Alphaproteobacteria bacterium]|nr:ATP-dependent helicase HrpB [Alphaproteobacteria bacterium]
MRAPLPIDEALPRLREQLSRHKNCVLEAPPGAGKTTRVPLALLNEPWAKGKTIVMLEPRRVAARAAAARMAQELGEDVGHTVGYRIRQDSRVSAATRIEVLTEGLLTRRLQNDPELAGVALLIFDEFHERSLAADLGLALALESQGALNDSLKILVMSATLDGERVSRLLGQAPVVRSEGRAYPVDTRYLAPVANARLDHEMAAAIRRALREDEGGVLAFLPGEGEIRSVMRALDDLQADQRVTLHPLYGALSAGEQDAAIRPAKAGVRKIVLATAIAETSLTIEDVRVVIDSGEQRLARYDPGLGLTRLVTQRVSLASADQRRGRAGRVAPGVCYRLWAEPETRALAPQTPPEMLISDLAPLALDLAQWGVSDPATLGFMDPPPAAAFAEAQGLLRDLGAIDPQKRITAHGKAMARFGAHPRLSHMMLRGMELGEGATAAALAAILTERDIMRGTGSLRDADARTRLDIFNGTENDPRADRGALARARDQARTWRRMLRVEEKSADAARAGLVTALGFPERVAKARGHGSFRLVNGRGAKLDETDALAREAFLAIAALDAGKADGKIHLAAPLSLSDIEELFGGQIVIADMIAWDTREKAVVARSERKLGSLVLSQRVLAKPDPEQLAVAALQGVAELGLNCLHWSDEAVALRARAAFVRRLDPEGAWPDFGDGALLETLKDWLLPFLGNVSRASDFARADVHQALKAQLTWEQSKRLDQLAPVALDVPSGSTIRIDYAGEVPVLAVRLQEMFGLTETPTVGGGRVPVLLHLLSPARRPVQVTRDLKSFWANGYPLVKKDLKGRYPKHHWPDDPWTAQATARAKPRGT